MPIIIARYRYVPVLALRRRRYSGTHPLKGCTAYRSELRKGNIEGLRQDRTQWLSLLQSESLTSVDLEHLNQRWARREHRHERKQNSLVPRISFYRIFWSNVATSLANRYENASDDRLGPSEWNYSTIKTMCIIHLDSGPSHAQDLPYARARSKQHQKKGTAHDPPC